MSDTLTTNPDHLLHAKEGTYVEGCFDCEVAEEAMSQYVSLRASSLGRDEALVRIGEGIATVPLQEMYDSEGRFIPFADNPQRHVYTTGGIKDNRGKAPVDLLPSAPLLEVARVLAFGATKYKPHNWRYGLPWRDTYASAMRHLLAWNDGETVDPETGITHLAHAVCQLLFLLEFTLKGIGEDDRHSAVVSTNAHDQSTG